MSKARILVIDDDATIRTVMQRLLGRVGYEVFLSEDGCSGLEAYDAQLPDLVITDYRMPRKDGLEVIAEIKSRNPEQKVLLVAASSEGVHREAIAAGADGIIEKPFEIRELAGKIQQCLAS